MCMIVSHTLERLIMFDLNSAILMRALLRLSLPVRTLLMIAFLGLSPL
jgi:hypothetical protein